MKKEDLIALGLTEEQADKVMELKGKAFNPVENEKRRLETENATLRDSVKDRDRQLEELKSSSGDVATLKKTIEDLQKTNKEKDDLHAAELADLRKNSALTAALMEAKARNPETVKPLLSAFLEKAELDGSTIKGLVDEIKKLVEDENTKFLFDAESKQSGFRGFTPGESKDSDGGDPPAATNLADAVAAYYKKE